MRSCCRFHTILLVSSMLVVLLTRPYICICWFESLRTRVFVHFCARSLCPKRPQRLMFRRVQANVSPSIHQKRTIATKINVNSVFCFFFSEDRCFLCSIFLLIPYTRLALSHGHRSKQNTHEQHTQRTHALLRCRFWSVFFIRSLLRSFSIIVCVPKEKLSARHGF